MPPTSVYKIRKLRKKEGGNERGFEACSLAVPIDVAERLSDDLKFTVELTEDGILYSPVEPTPDDKIPSWVSQQQKSGPGKSAKSK
jgi:hypothetical protein